MIVVIRHLLARLIPRREWVSAALKCVCTGERFALALPLHPYTYTRSSLLRRFDLCYVYIVGPFLFFMFLYALFLKLLLIRCCGPPGLLSLVRPLIFFESVLFFATRGFSIVFF